MARDTPETDTDLDKTIEIIEETETTNPDTGSGIEELPESEPIAIAQPKKPWIRRFHPWLLFFAVLLITLFAIPFTRYAALGFVVKKDVSLTIIDSKTKKPVGGATVSLGRIDGTSNPKGEVTLSGVAVGEHHYEVKAKHYKEASGDMLVPIFGKMKQGQLTVEAQGRVVSFIVKNEITSETLPGVTISVNGQTTTTDQKGASSLVYPIGEDVVTTTFARDGYTTKQVEVMITRNDKPQEVRLTPDGTVMVLSKRSGVVDVVRVTLDGSLVETVIKGTGSEVDYETSLVAAPNWKYAALLSRRDGDRVKLFMVNNATAELTLADDSVSIFEPIGWIGDRFYYKTSRTSANIWEPKQQSIRAYDAEAKARTIIDETEASGASWYDYSSQQLSSAYIVGKRVVYAKSWTHSEGVADKSRPGAVVSIDGTTKSLVKTLTPGNGYVDALLKSPSSIYFRLTGGDNASTYYRYISGKVDSFSGTEAEFMNPRTSYLLSPDESKAFWSEPRDGKNILFVAGSDIKSPTQVSASGYLPFGWVGNEYVLYTKNQSELYIAPAGKVFNGEFKITDYHKSPLVGPGFGMGYGASY